MQEKNNKTSKNVWSKGQRFPKPEDASTRGTRGFKKVQNSRLAMALLDRLVERAIILKIKGKTYRTPLVKSENNPA